MTETAPDLMQRLHDQNPVQGAIKVVHLPSPDQQLEQFLNTPGMTPHEVEFSKNWTYQESARRRQQVHDWVKERRASHAIKSKDLDADIFGVTQASNALGDRVRKGEFSSTRELFAEAKKLRDRLANYERVIESLESTEASIAEVEADPDAYWTSFYSRFHTLAANLPNLADALTEFRESKR